MNKNMIPLPSQTRRPTTSTPRTSSTEFLHQFIGDFLRMLYLHGHTHTLAEFVSGMNEVFEQVHQEFGMKHEVSYERWVSRKNQWDKDFEIKDGGPSKEVCDGLHQYRTFLECNEGKIRPRARQPGHWLRSDLDLNLIVENQRLPLGTQQSEKYLDGHGPVHHQRTYPLFPGGSLNNALQNPIVQPSANSESFTQRHFDAHRGLTISPSRLPPANINEWNAGDPTLLYGLSPYTYPSLPREPIGFVQDPSGGRSRTNTSISSDPSSNSASTAQSRDTSYPQGQPRA